MTGPMWRDAAPDLDDEEFCRPVILAFENSTVRATGQLTSEPVVTEDTLRMEQIGAIIEARRGWRELVRQRIATYHDMLSSNPSSIYGVY